MLSVSNLKVILNDLGCLRYPLKFDSIKKKPVSVFDIYLINIDELNDGKVRTYEVSKEELAKVIGSSLSASLKSLKKLNLYIIKGSTIFQHLKCKSLTSLRKTNLQQSKMFKEDEVMIYEYFGCIDVTQETYTSVLNKVSNLKLEKNLYACNSTERINLVSKFNSIINMLKITTNTSAVIKFNDKLYGLVFKENISDFIFVKIYKAIKSERIYENFILKTPFGVGGNIISCFEFSIIKKVHFISKNNHLLF